MKSFVKAWLGPQRWHVIRMRWWQLKRAVEIDHCAVQMPWFVKRDSPQLAFLNSLATRIDWDYAPHLEARLCLWLGAMFWPLGSCWHVMSAARRFGAPVRAASGISVGRQCLDMWILANRHNVPPLSYYQCRLFEPSRRRSLGSWIHYFEICNLLPELNRDRPAHLLDDKDHFVRQIAALGLPGIPVVATFSQGRLDGERIQLPEGDLVLKPVDLCSGSRFERWSFEAGRWSNGRQVLDAQGLVAHCEERSREHRLVLQPRVFNHAALRPLAGNGLCTVRIVSGRPLRGSSVALFATLRMPTGSAMVDNFNAGGIAAPVDMGTGVLGSAVGRYLTSGVFDAHPTSGAPILGFQLPYWSDAVALVLRSHDCFAWVPFVGWDIVIAPDGPHLLEANMTWSAELLQLPHGQPLGSTQFTPIYIEHYQSRGNSVSQAQLSSASGG